MLHVDVVQKQKKLIMQANYDCTGALYNPLVHIKMNSEDLDIVHT